MKKILVIFCVLFLIFSTAAFAKTLPDENAAKDLSNKIMAKVTQGDLSAAFNTMKPYTFIGPAEIDAIVIQSKASREKSGQRSGKATGYEFIDSKKIKDSLLRLRYLEKNEKNTLFWEFYFYKTSKGWVLDSFNWNEAYRPLFESSKE